MNILAKTTQFSRGIGSARKSLSGFRAHVKSVGKGVLGFGSTLLGIATVGGLAAFAKSTINTAVRLGEVSDKLGIATHDLELMRFAAEATGVAQTSLDTALQRMVRRVGQAAQGTGEAKKVLDRLNISAEELNKLNPAEQFTAIGDAITDIPDKGGQLAATMAIFDTEGVGLVNLMADGLNRYASAFERAGGPTSARGVKNAREFAFHAQQLKGALGALGRDFVLDVTPTALEAISGMQTIMEAFQRGGRAAAERETRRVRNQTIIDPGRFRMRERIGGFAIGIAERFGAVAGGDITGITGRDRTPVGRSTVRQRELEQQRRSLIRGRPELGGATGIGELLENIRSAITQQTKVIKEVRTTTNF